MAYFRVFRLMQEFNEFITSLRVKLMQPLPGAASQMLMASMRRVMEHGRTKVPDGVKKGGVLVLLYPSDGKIFIVFMKRTEYPGVHSGQVSFPGGGWEPGDESMTKTALREAEEEIGVDQKTVNILGQLSDLFIPPSNFLVTPVVGYTEQRPAFIPDPVEVERILEVSLDHLLLKETRQVREITVFPDNRMRVPCFYAGGDIIWGATAMIINELIDVISQGS